MGFHMYYGNYRGLVLEDFLQKRANDSSFSQNLIKPTPAALKAECKSVCAERYDEKDVRTLKGFFGNFEDKAGCEEVIEWCKTDKFRPLESYLNEETTEPGLRIIELLAWVIDFKDRPFDRDKRYSEPKTLVLIKKKWVEKEKISIDAEDTSMTSAEGNATPDTTEPLLADPPTAVTETNTQAVESQSTAVEIAKPNGKRRIVALASLFLFISIGVLYLFHNDIAGMGKCMYWTGDHYKEIPCNQQPGNNAVVIPWDSKLINLKRITRPDTITSKEIGHVWYERIDMQHIEFFTADGFLPTDTQRRLKPITVYIINKYIAHLDSIAQQTTMNNVR